MVVIGFFRDLFQQFTGLFSFVTTPLGQLNHKITIEPLASMSILTALGSSIVVVLIALLVVHFIRLFIGG